MDSSISTSMSDLTLMMFAIEECVDCCSNNAAVSAEVILAEVFFLSWNFCWCLPLVLAVDCCCVLVFNVLHVVFYDSGMLESWIAFCADCVLLFTVVVVLNRLLYWLIGECQILNIFWKCCCCWSAPWNLRNWCSPCSLPT